MTSQRTTRKGDISPFLGLLSTLDLASISYFPRPLNSSPLQFPGTAQAAQLDHECRCTAGHATPPLAHWHKKGEAHLKCSMRSLPRTQITGMFVLWIVPPTLVCWPRPALLTDFVTRSAPSNRTLRAVTAVSGPPHRALLINRDGLEGLQISESG